MYRIAHLSDLHLEDANEIPVALATVDYTIRKGVDHIAITGDVVDCAQLDIIEAFGEALRERRYAGAHKLTIVPGNHDIIPSHAPQPVERRRH